MREKNYIGVGVSELLGDLIDITGSHTEAEYLIDEVVDAYDIEYNEELNFMRGEITREKLEKEREKRRLDRYSESLRRNMERMGQNRPKNSSTHHIVARNDNRAYQARILLEQVGISLDDEINGVYLPMYRKFKRHPGMPHAYSHSEIHTDIYYLNTTTLLARKKGDRIGIENVLKNIALNLTDGTFPIHEKIGRA